MDNFQLKKLRKRQLVRVNLVYLQIAAVVLCILLVHFKLMSGFLASLDARVSFGEGFGLEPVKEECPPISGKVFQPLCDRLSDRQDRGNGDKGRQDPGNGDKGRQDPGNGDKDKQLNEAYLEDSLTSGPAWSVALAPGTMSRYDHSLESEQPLFEKPCYSNIRSSSGDNNSSGSIPNGHHHHSPTSDMREELDSPDLKSQPDTAGFLAQHQVLEARVARLQARLLLVGGITIVGFNILIVLSAVFFTKLHYDVAHHTHKPKLGTQMAAILQEGLCVPCEEFRLGPSPEEEMLLNLYRDESSGGGSSSRCCVNKPGELLELLKLYIERRFRLELAKGTVNAHWPTVSEGEVLAGPRPAAHFMMPRQDKSQVKNIRGRQYQIVQWLFNGDMAFTTGGAYHQHGRIVVPLDGYYFVYSQISFLEEIDPRSVYDPMYSNTSPSLSVYLYRYNMLYTKGGEEKLAQNSITKCWGQNKNIGEYTNSLGAVFFLRQKDEVFIKVSNLSMVVDEPKSTYFGLFKI
ncbi:tumor necrosis factor ligand superfamily member 11 [Plakobranchus ocellatus]|uniref:Tumor necrosis factor ligand superfamily member 11 n=1 Tax=Plakobranchus ocellatus TaxID=259542 RepID=A0AAV4DXQ7_9GAST|nr:tumor necrosis factor ligand superfamily member 11 [Plakobranchus ocellatus]